jgi:tripartite-type tricarboxylate transporter receptor subunit TctC
MRYRIFFILAFQIFLAASATADEYPSRPIRMIVPFAPGGTADLIARPLALKLGELLGESIVVINRGGAGGVVGASLVAQAQPDGYTILLGSNGALTISQHLGPVPYDTVKDFSPVGIAATSQFVLVRDFAVFRAALCPQGAAPDDRGGSQSIKYANSTWPQEISRTG